MADQREWLIVTRFNELFWDCGSAHPTVIEHGLPGPRHRYRGEVARLAFVVNESVRRWRTTGTDRLPRFGSLPLDTFGIDGDRLPTTLASHCVDLRFCGNLSPRCARRRRRRLTRGAYARRLCGPAEGISSVVNQPAQQQDVPGVQSEMRPVPDCGEDSYIGTGKLTGKVAVITGADSGIGRAAAIAFAREGADVVISYLSEDEDAQEVARYVTGAGQRAVLIRGDLSDAQHCRDIIATAVEQLGGIDILVSNAAFQMTHESLEEIPDEEWDYTFDVNVRAMFHLCKAAVPHMKPGASIIGSSSVNSDMPSPQLAPYAATKAAIANFCASLAQLLGEKGIRVNSVAPGPIWTPLIPATMPKKKVASFGSDTPLGRAGQPAELAPVYVLLASDDGSYISGARIAVTGGRPIL